MTRIEFEGGSCSFHRFISGNQGFQGLAETFDGVCIIRKHCYKAVKQRLPRREKCVKSVFMAEMIDRAGRSSVPQAFIDDVHIGGYDDQAEFDASGKLGRCLDQANVLA